MGKGFFVVVVVVCMSSSLVTLFPRVLKNYFGGLLFHFIFFCSQEYEGGNVYMFVRKL